MTTSTQMPGNPLAEIPVAGGPVARLDGFLLDLGFSPVGAQSAEFLLLVAALFVVLAVLVGRLLPWMCEQLLERAEWLTLPVPALLLAPEWLVTKLLVKSGRAPGRLIYGYGDGVLVVADAVAKVVTAALRVLRRARSRGGFVACSVILSGFLWWNSETCVGDLSPCVSPARHWAEAVSAAAEN